MAFCNRRLGERGVCRDGLRPYKKSTIRLVRSDKRKLGDRIASYVEGAFFCFGLVAQPPIGEGRKIVGDGFDGRAQFELGEPATGDRFHSGGSAEKIAGNRACRIAVTAVIYGENDSVFKIFCSERAVQPHRQRFFGYEPFSKLA